jgi:hypothetical protein
MVADKGASSLSTAEVMVMVPLRAENSLGRELPRVGPSID